MTSKLFSPLQIRGVTLPNRIVVAPMWTYRGIDGFATDWHLMNLGRFAEGGAGLVFQEGTTVQRSGCGTLYDLGIWDDKFIEPLRRVTSLVTACGGVPAIQIMHAGRKARSRTPFEGRGPLAWSSGLSYWDEWQPTAASAVPTKEGLEPPRAMTLPEITDTVAAFGAAARRARLAGYKVLEIHGAHGYLIHSFLSPAINKREDRYGGSFENRTRFLTQIVEAVRAEWDHSAPVFVRLSCIDNGGWELDDTVALARILMKLGVDVLDCSAGGLFGSPMAADNVPKYGYQIDYSSRVRRETGMTTMAVGLIVHAAHAEQALVNGDADLIAIAREMLFNPCWASDAAQKLGIDPDFTRSGPRTGFWLAGRQRTKPDLVLSTNFLRQV